MAARLRSNPRPDAAHEYMRHRFTDGNGYLDTDAAYRHIGRFIWTDDQPWARWVEKPIYQWTATELYGLTGDEFDLVFEHVRPFPGGRTEEQRIADELYWKRITPTAYYRARKLQEELPRKSCSSDQMLRQ